VPRDRSPAATRHLEEKLMALLLFRSYNPNGAPYYKLTDQACDLSGMLWRHEAPQEWPTSLGRTA
jgi:hypothetical protein